MDLEFLSGNFFEHEIPKDKQYLCKYFATDLQMSFLRYRMVFEDIYLFKDHTGFYCSDRLVFRLIVRYKQLIKIHDEAKANFTEEGLNTLQLIESGQYPLTGDEFS